MKFNLGKKVLAVTLAALTIITTGFTGLPTTVHAAEGNINVHNGPYMSYGSYTTNIITVDNGSGVAYCAEPMYKTPHAKEADYTTSYNLIPGGSNIRKALYYLYGGPGSSALEGNFSGWSTNDRYIVSHLAVAYLFKMNGEAQSGDPFFGANQNYKNKTTEVLNAISSMANPPEYFKAFQIPSPGSHIQTLVGTWSKQEMNTYLTMKKTSALPAISDGNSCYSLAGAQYTVYTDGGCTSPAKDINGNTAVLTTDANGNANTLHFNFEGTVYVKETRAPQGYEKDSNVQSVALTKDTTVTFTASDQPGNDPVVLFLSKKDAETGESSPAGGAKLEGAKYTVKYYDTISTSDPAASGATPKRTWVFQTDKDGFFYLSDSYKVSGDELYSKNGVSVLPLGTVTITETKAPDGYKRNDEVYVVNTKMDAASRRVITTNLPTEENAVKEQVFRGDFRIRKIEASSGRTLANIPFRITSVETGEYHDIMTDENGVYDSSSSFVKHSQDTNGGKATSGLWFTGESTGTKAPIDDSLGALPYGNYKIEELPCKENEKYVPFNDTFTVSRDGYTVDFNTIPNWDKPEISSDATGDLGNSHFAMSDTGMSINDRVSYDNITENALKYYGVNGTSNLTMVSKIFDKTTGAFLKDANGNDLSFSKTFEAKRQSGSISMMLTADSSNLAGHTLVIYEYLYGKSADNSDILLAKEEDPNEESQMIFIPKIETNATEKTIGDHFLKAGSDATINDTIKYTNLPENKTFFIDGKLVDSQTGETVTDANGQPVVNTLKVTTNAQNGTFTNSFHFQVPSEWEGRTFVICETVRDRGNMVYTSEENLKNADQTLHVVKVRTTASDGQTKDHVGTLTKTATIVDAVKFWNLIPGKTYTISGTLQDKKTGKALKDASGKNISATKTFVADKADGTMDLSFTLDSSTLEDTPVVAFESITVKGKEIGVHADLSDEDQTIHYPKVRTKAIDKYTGDHVGTLFGKVETAIRNMLHIESKDKQSIVDTVSISDLVVGQKYTVSGVLMNKKTGEAAKDENGNPIVGTTGEFTATAANLTKEITYSVDASNYENTTFVVFETLSHNDVDVAKHNDINDEDQSIYNMESHTTYVSGETKDHVGVVTEAGKTTTTIDTVAVNNLKAGETYTITGTLHVKETGEELKDKDGKAISATKTFQAGDTSSMNVLKANGNSISGSIDLTFTYDSSLLSGKTVVAFETVDHNGKTIYVHADLNDENQSVHYPDLHTTASDAKTGDHVGTTDGTQTIHDAVKLSNLIPGQTYVVKGSLYNVTKGQAIEGSEKTLTFTAEKANETRNIDFSIDTDAVEGQTVVVLENLYHKDVKVKTHENPNDKNQMVHYPKIRTKAIDKTTGDHVGTLFGKVQNAVRQMLGLPTEEKQTVVDTVKYWNLIPGETYSISGVLMDKSTGEAVKDSDGKTVTATTGDFVADKVDGSMDISYSVDASKYENTTFVVFETLHHKNVDVAKHNDINDEDQSIYNMESHTTYVSGETKDHVGVVTEAGKTTTTIDTVAVNNLKAGETYTITGTLHVKETGEELKDKDGKAISATKTFQAGDTSSMNVLKANGNSISGSIDLTFTYDSSLLSGKTVVAFETVDHNGKTIYVHADLSDENQSVHYPDLSSKALNTETKDQSGNLGTMKLTDTITMKNLIPGQEYTVKGIVMDKDTGKAVSAEGTKTFTAKKSKENIVLSFTVKNDGSLEGHTLVLCDTMYHNNILVKTHKDLNDKDQSIYVPKIRTTAVDGKSGTHSGIIGSTTLVDTISYENLIPGKEYTVFGSLMNARTGEKMIDLAGNYMEAKKTFTATARNGKVSLAFAIDSRLLKDVTVVAFEDLYHEDVKVAVHADLTDKDQSVHYPGIGTSATVNGSHYAPTAKRTKLVDRVWYQNLVPGHTYRVEGTLMDKATNKPILINGGEVTVKKDFVPKSSNGYVDMEYVFNSSSLDKHTVVVFEHMYDGKVLLTSHADINDAAQSVRFDNAPAKGLSPKTGDPTNPFLPAVPFGAASLMLVLLLLKKKKRVTR